MIQRIQEKGQHNCFLFTKKYTKTLVTFTFLRLVKQIHQLVLKNKTVAYAFTETKKKRGYRNHDPFHVYTRMSGETFGERQGGPDPPPPPPNCVPGYSRNLRNSLENFGGGGGVGPLTIEQE